jgi:hypothetical protein
MALAQNEPAMQKFENMTEPEKEAFVEKTHQVTSKREMEQLVATLTD